jgi:hypothetical protein
MSFGFSIGDFITVIELANEIRKEFVGAPIQFKNISDKYIPEDTADLLLMASFIKLEAFPSFFKMLISSYPSARPTNNRRRIHRKLPATAIRSSSI